MRLFVPVIRLFRSTPNFTDEEKASGFEIVWVEPKEAIKLLNLKQTSSYEGKFIEERDFCFLTKALQEEGLVG